MGDRCPVAQPDFSHGGHLVARKREGVTVLLEKGVFVAAPILNCQRALEEIAEV